MMDCMDYSTMTNHKITLDPNPNYVRVLMEANAFMLDPLDDPTNSDLRTENIFIYWLFGLQPPPPSK
jgi:hypothetical protein